MIGQGAALPPFLFIALGYSRGRGAIFRRNIEFAVLGSGIGVLQYYVRCKTQSFFARGSSKPLPYDVEMGFGDKTIFFDQIRFRQRLHCVLYLFLAVGQGLIRISRR